MSSDQLVQKALEDGSYYSNPYPLFDILRSQDPVFYSEALGGWVLTKYVDIDYVLKESEIFSSKGRVLHLIEKLDPEIKRQLTLLQSHFATGLAHSDAPEHRRLRGLLARAFTPKMIENARPMIAATVKSQIDPLGSRFDLIADVFTPIPALVVGKILGSQESDIPDLIRWAHAINGLYEKGGHIDPRKALHAEAMLEEIRGFVQRLVAARRDLRENGQLNPDSDILAALVSAEQEAGALSEAELVSTVVTLFVAGHETTTHLLGNGFYALLSNAEELEKVRRNPSLIPSVVEEMARFDGSVPRSWRITKESIEIRGVAIPERSLVLPILAAANRDPEIFIDPHLFDSTRDSRKHLAYGKGVHVCLGAPLARIEAQEVLKYLFLHRPKLRLTSENLEWRKDVALRGLISLPVES